MCGPFRTLAREVARRKWFKRSLLGLAVVLTAAAAVGYWAFKGTPDYYHRPTLTAAERADAANRAIEKFRQGKEWANDVWVGEHRALLVDSAGGAASTSPSTSPATRPGQSLTISFTETELNAFFQQWSADHWEGKFGQYVKDPAVVLRDGRLIIIGTVIDAGAVISFHFQSRIDAQSRLLLTLESVRAGRLPMPEMMYAAQRDRLLAALESRLPGWQQDATIAPNGVANDAAVAAHMSQLLIDVMHRAPREPVLFLPFDVDGRAVPVRLTDVQITDGDVTLTVESMNAEDRAALLERIREPAPTVTASAQRP